MRESSILSSPPFSTWTFDIVGSHIYLYLETIEKGLKKPIVITQKPGIRLKMCHSPGKDVNPVSKGV